MPMVMAALHPTGEVGLVGSAELPQPDSIAANATHTGIRINIRKLPLLDGSLNRVAYAMLIREYDRPVFQPYVSAKQSPAELSVKAVVIGVGGLETGRIDRA
jgi:hypothetical protein